MKKYLSYIWPITKKVPSDHSGMVEITWYNGRKMLNSKSANYSYGNLQKVLNHGLAIADLVNIKGVLILGMGGGSIIQSLRNKYQYNGNIHAVEIDARIIELAKIEFGISESDNLAIENADAFEFVQKRRSSFDLIVVDLFIDRKVPTIFYGKEFFHNLIKLVNQGGSVLFNSGINLTADHPATEMINRFQNEVGFRCTVLQKVQRLNTLLIARKMV